MTAMWILRAAPRSIACRILPVAMLLVATAAAVAQAPAAGPQRPRIGLVLGGGGAKGAAHVGVLRVLDEMRIPIDCIVGTSMGALVGGTFAAGKAPAQIEREVLDIDWSRTVGGQGLRDSTPISRKIAEIVYSNPLELGISKNGLRTPGGLLGTQQIEQEIRRLVATARFIDDFDELPIPFRAVATDMVAGDMVVLGDGDLAVAMRASMAIPGAFSPIAVDGMVLADGGLMRNLPIDIARDLCADVVIAVWFSTPPLAEQDLTSALSMIGRSLEVVVRSNERVQIATLTDADVGIAVDISDIGTSEFERTPEAIELGRAAVAPRAAELARYSLSADGYSRWRAGVDRAAQDRYMLSDVRVVGLDRVSEAYVRAQLTDAVPGTELEMTSITAGTERVYALGDFERVDYRLMGTEENRVLEIEPVEKSWGPDFLRLNIGVSTDESADILGVIRIDHNRTWINSRGGQWHNALQIGGRSAVMTDFYQPLDVRQRYFVQPIAAFESNREDVYLDKDRAARYFARRAYGQVDLGLNIGTRAQLRFGLRRAWTEADLDTGLPGLPETDRVPDTSLQLRAFYDTRDAVALPTRGTLVSARYAHGDDWFGGDEEYRLFEGMVAKSFNFRGNSLTLTLGGADVLSGEPPIPDALRLGGIRTFPGLRVGELRGTSYWFAGSTYRWRLFDLSPLFGQRLYAGLRLQAGEMRERLDDVDDGTLYGIAGSVSGQTPIGPFTLSLGYVDNGSRLLQFSLGRPISEGSILDSVY